MDPAAYDAWYESPRGKWIGEREFRLLRGLLAPRPGDTLLDVGSGTGHFTRRFAAAGLQVTGLDRDVANVNYARRLGGAAYEIGDATRLPFTDASFDLTLSVTASCLVAEARTALAEMARVTRRRLMIGLLHRHSLLYLQKGRSGGRGAYRGAHWHTPHLSKDCRSSTRVFAMPYSCRRADALRAGWNPDYRPGCLWAHSWR